MIQARIRKTYRADGERPSFTLDVEFQASQGVTVLFGPGGAGKTLALDVIAGLVQPDDGRILIDDQILYDRATGINRNPAERRCGYIFANPALIPHMTLRQNLLFAAACRNLPRLERHRQVNETLERFRLNEAGGRHPREASESERQRCSVARAVIGQPRLLLVDEPSGDAGAALRSELLSLLQDVRAESGIPVLLATRRLDDCFELGEEMLAIDGGRLLQSGPPRSVFEQPANVGVARLLGCFNLLPVKIEMLDPGKNTSRLRLGDEALAGLYYPGRLRGDLLTLCVRHDQLRAAPAAGKPGPNQIRAALQRVAEGRHTVRLHFAGEIVVEMPRLDYEEKKHVREWFVEFPQDKLRVL